MTDMLKASGPFIFLIFVIMAMVLTLGFIIARITKNQYKGVKYNVYDPKKEEKASAEKFKHAETEAAAQKTEPVKNLADQASENEAAKYEGEED